jgi:hypothetical protein
MKNMLSLVDLQAVMLQELKENDLPEECLPSEAKWMVTENKPYYPKVMFFREETEVMQWYAFFVRDALKHNNPENVRAVTIGSVCHNQVLIDSTD